MKRRKGVFPIAPGKYKELKNKMLNWSKQFSIILFLDSNNYSSVYGRYECLLGIGCGADIVEADSFEKLNTHHRQAKDWLLGHITYDFKNALEGKLHSAHPIKIGFPVFSFFIPSIVCYITPDHAALTIECSTDDPEDVFKNIFHMEPNIEGLLPKLRFSYTTNKDEYLDAVSALRQHIADGDCYEINYCTEGYCENVAVDPLVVFSTLNALSPAPFASFYRLADTYMMCASPERYLRKKGVQVLAQPIKGTARRDADADVDARIKKTLYEDIKERAENVMIVDLMRNDLARSCEVGSVQVEELFGIYSFPQVHQMISTISGQLRAQTPFTEALKYSFPMGSMTGAPKVKVMQLIERYEKARRELYSGTVGYITPEGDFDFNVVIRSLFFNADTKYLSYQTGGAITYDSDPEKEWLEMRLKAWALERIFS